MCGEVVEKIGGGMVNNRPFRAMRLGGGNTLLLRENLDMPLLRGGDVRDDEQGHKYEHILDNGNALLHGDDDARKHVRDYDCARDRGAKAH